MPGYIGDDQLMPMLNGAVIGGVGGAVNYLREKSAKDWGKFLIAVLTSAFSGMLAELVADWLNADVRLQFALAGIAGYIGVKLLDDVASRVRRMVNGGLDSLEEAAKRIKEKKK